MWPWLIYCSSLVVASAAIVALWRMNFRGAGLARVAILWATGLTVVPIWPVAVVHLPVEASDIFRVAVFVVVGSVVFYGAVLPHFTAYRLRDIGWRGMSGCRGVAGALVGATLAFSIWPSKTWPHILLPHPRLGLAVVVAAYALGVVWQEETLFRGYLQGALKRERRLTVESAVVWQACLYALATAIVYVAYFVGGRHASPNAISMITLRQAPFRVLAGLVLGYMREHYDSLWPSYVAHMTYVILATLAA
jgi:membrane protease YdiL (CAAX protease family)